MRDPAKYYRDLGGEVFLADLTGLIIGGVAVKRLHANGYEFCKLVVTREARGLGAGKALVESCLNYVRQQGGGHLFLQSFKALETALIMYRHMGFSDCEAPAGMRVLARTEVIMSLKL